MSQVSEMIEQEEQEQEEEEEGEKIRYTTLFIQIDTI